MKKLCTIVVSLFVILFISLPQSMAAEVSLVPAHTDIKNPKSFSNLIVNGQPGDEIHGEFAAVNLTDSKMSLKLKTLDATVRENGEIVGSENASPSGVGRWLVTTDREIILLPKERKILGYSIKIPADVQAGEHVGAIFANNASLPVWVKVEGATTADFSLGELTNDFKNDKPEFKISLKNKGNSVINNLGFTLTLTNYLGLGADRSLRNFWGEETPILPGQEKEFTLPLENPLSGVIGNYQAALEVSSSGQTKNATLAFTFIGWNIIRGLILQIIVFLLFIAGVIFILKKFMPRFSISFIKSILGRKENIPVSSPVMQNQIQPNTRISNGNVSDISDEVKKITAEEKNIASLDETGYDKIWFKVRKIVREEIELWKEMENFRREVKEQLKKELSGKKANNNNKV